MPKPSPLASALATVGVTPVTPFSEDLTCVDRAALRANLEFLLDAGVDLLFPAGNTGEGASLSAEEWETVVEISLEVAAGRAAVVPGVGAELPVAVDLANRAAALGADGILLMPRSQPYATSAGTVAYWLQVLDNAPLPAVVYRRARPEDTDLLVAVEHELVVGCKYGGRDVAGFASTVTAAPEKDLVWICGVAERYAPFHWLAGARGFTSGLANFAPVVALDLHRALVAGDLDEALRISARCDPFERVRARDEGAPNVAAVKAAMDAVGLAGGRVRPPLRDLEESTSHEVKRLVAQLTAGESS